MLDYGFGLDLVGLIDCCCFTYSCFAVGLRVGRFLVVVWLGGFDCCGALIELIAAYCLVISDVSCG